MFEISSFVHLPSASGSASCSAGGGSSGAGVEVLGRGLYMCLKHNVRVKICSLIFYRAQPSRYGVRGRQIRPHPMAVISASVAHTSLSGYYKEIHF
jgi:hypothetical protein